MIDLSMNEIGAVLNEVICFTAYLTNAGSPIYGNHIFVNRLKSQTKF
jgi:hypothetical protein